MSSSEDGAHCLLGCETVEGLPAAPFLAPKFLDALTEAAAVNLSTTPPHHHHLATAKNHVSLVTKHTVPLPLSFTPAEALVLLSLLRLPHSVRVSNYNLALLPRGKKLYQPL